MVGIIARKEFTELVREGRFRAAAALVALLLGASLWLGAHQQRDLAGQEAWAREALRQQWLEQGEKNPHSAAHFGTYAIRPRLAPALLDRGIEAFSGVAVWLEAHRQNELRYRPAQDGSSAQRFGELGAALVLQVLLPLLIALMAFDAYTRERERGTLPLLLATGVDLRSLALGKLLGVGAGLALLLVPAAAFGVLALWLGSGGEAFAAALPRLGALAGVYLVYFALFTALALAISARASSSRLALVALLGFWALNALLMPRLSSDAARTWVPTPSAAEFAAAIARDLRDGFDGHSSEGQRAAELEQRVLERYDVARIEELPVSFAGLRLQEGEEFGAKVFDHHFGQLWEAFAAQNRAAAWGGVLAPLLPVRSLSMALAGSDFDHQRHFASAAEGYRRSFIQILNDDITRNAGAQTAYRAGPELWAQIPDFEYTSPGLGWALAQQRGALLVLAGWCAFAAGALHFAVLRVRPA
jgi:ABC-2 type transport system permease protein